MLQAGLARASLLSTVAPHSTSLSLGTDTVGLGEFSIEGQTLGTGDSTVRANCWLTTLDPREAVADYVPEETQITDPL
jgi:hypothetical protein